jgi:LmbE family N-acetylglucosaminyl deacetylase
VNEIGHPYADATRDKVLGCYQHSLVVVSPHLDDAVLSCGSLLASTRGSVVITVFDAGPETIDPLPVWDRECGFSPGDDVYSIRHAEDDAALSCVGARGVRLGLWDGQYRPRRWRQRVANRLAQTYPRLWRGRVFEPEVERTLAGQLERYVREITVEAWCVPCGLLHPDHRIVAHVCARCAAAHPEKRWLVYDELPYTRESTDAERRAADAVYEAAGLAFDATNVVTPVVAFKRSLAHCYKTQLTGLGERATVAVNASERYRLLRSAASAEVSDRDLSRAASVVQPPA